MVLAVLSSSVRNIRKESMKCGRKAYQFRVWCFIRKIREWYKRLFFSQKRNLCCLAWEKYYCSKTGSKKYFNIAKLVTQRGLLFICDIPVISPKNAIALIFGVLIWLNLEHFITSLFWNCNKNLVNSFLFSHTYIVRYFCALFKFWVILCFHCSK
jgi:hypothetical protein